MKTLYGLLVERFQTNVTISLALSGAVFVAQSSNTSSILLIRASIAPLIAHRFSNVTSETLY